MDFRSHYFEFECSLDPFALAHAAVFFASDDSRWITAETLVIARGLRYYQQQDVLITRKDKP